MTSPVSPAEFPRIERLDAIGSEERTVAIAATPEERAALAQRFGLVAIERLEASFAIRREAAGIAARGRVEAAVVQACAVTGEPLTQAIDEPVSLLFVEPGAGGEDEVELAADALDTVEITGGGIDLGEAAAETVALALDPYSRSPAAAAALREAGVLSEEDARPLGALAGLKQALEKKSRA
ncbi:YceD family protein [Sphingomonas corticis]|uniref:YceD family protein n=1 Tax=Sphingomonas corticis TaxID=2722791 RepID=UPI003B839C4A